MAYLAVDKDGKANIFELLPSRSDAAGGSWGSHGSYILISSDTANKLIGRNITWEDEPVELK